MPSSEEMSSYKDLSLKLYDVLESCGISTAIRETRTECSAISEKLYSIACSPDIRHYIFGSLYECSFTHSMDSDVDQVFVQCSPPVVCQAECLSDLPYGLLLIPDQRFQGYAKLQVFSDGTEQFTEEFLKQTNKSSKHVIFGIRSDGQNRRCLTLKYLSNYHGFKGNQHGPALQIKAAQNKSTDTVYALECGIWPSFAAEWLTRRRENGWPTKHLIQKIKTYGFIVVKAYVILRVMKKICNGAYHSLAKKESLW